MERATARKIMKRAGRHVTRRHTGARKKKSGFAWGDSCVGLFGAATCPLVFNPISCCWILVSYSLLLSARYGDPRIETVARTERIRVVLCRRVPRE